MEVKNEIGKLVVEVSEKILQQELAKDAVQDQYVQNLTEQIKLN